MLGGGNITDYLEVSKKTERVAPQLRQKKRIRIPPLSE
jgi:hypothetical protein